MRPAGYQSDRSERRQPSTWPKRCYHGCVDGFVLIAVDDLMFQPRVEAAARDLGFETAVADSVLTAREGLARRPVLVVVDLHAREFVPEAVIRAAGAIGAPVLAFGRHTEPGLLRDARRWGAAVSVPRSELVERLPALIAQTARQHAPSDEPA